MGVERYRQRFNFWLDTSKPDEYELAETIDELKEKRLFMKTLRQAFTLYLSLRSHDTSVLLSLFPWVREDLASQTAQAEHIERLEALAQQFQSMMTLPHQTTPALSPPMPKNTEPLSVVFDEKAAVARSIQNTLASMKDF